MGKKHITARIDEGTAEDLDRWAGARGIGRSEAIERLIRAGLDEGEEGGEAPPETPQEPSGAPTAGNVGGGDPQVVMAVVDALKASNADLRAALIDARATVATLTAQLDVKDHQIEAAHGLADHAQKLQAMEAQRLLPAEGRARGGWISSIFRRR